MGRAMWACRKWTVTDLTRESVEAELAAAKAVAAKIGLGSIEPQILKLAKHTTARLAPLPILARIQSAASPDQAYANASREVTVAAHLSAHGAPAVRVARNIAPGPHVENGCVITLWDFLEGQPAQSDVDAAAAARSLRQCRTHPRIAPFSRIRQTALAASSAVSPDT